MKLTAMTELRKQLSENKPQVDRRIGGDGADQYFLDRRRQLYGLVQQNTSIPAGTQASALNMIKKAETADQLRVIIDKLKAHKVITEAGVTPQTGVFRKKATAAQIRNNAERQRNIADIPAQHAEREREQRDATFNAHTDKILQDRRTREAQEAHEAGHEAGKNHEGLPSDHDIGEKHGHHPSVVKAYKSAHDKAATAETEKRYGPRTKYHDMTQAEVYVAAEEVIKKALATHLRAFPEKSEQSDLISVVNNSSEYRKIAGVYQSNYSGDYTEFKHKIAKFATRTAQAHHDNINKKVASKDPDAKEKAAAVKAEHKRREDEQKQRTKDTVAQQKKDDKEKSDSQKLTDLAQSKRKDVPAHFDHDLGDTDEEVAAKAKTAADRAAIAADDKFQDASPLGQSTLIKKNYREAITAATSGSNIQTPKQLLAAVQSSPAYKAHANWIGQYTKEQGGDKAHELTTTLSDMIHKKVNQINGVESSTDDKKISTWDPAHQGLPPFRKKKSESNLEDTPAKKPTKSLSKLSNSKKKATAKKKAVAKKAPAAKKKAASKKAAAKKAPATKGPEKPAPKGLSALIRDSKNKDVESSEDYDDEADDEDEYDSKPIATPKRKGSGGSLSGLLKSSKKKKSVKK